jgi:hypothetical protein
VIASRTVVKESTLCSDTALWEAWLVRLLDWRTTDSVVV